MVDTKLFISHAANDQPLVKSFVELIEGGIGVPPRDIFCSSLKGQGIRPGADFTSSIRDQLDGATCVVALLSPNFYGSAFCMCELGGTWLQAKSFVPMLVPPLQFSDLKAVLAGLQAGKLSEAADLDELRDEIASRLSITPLATPRWNDRRDSFLKSLPKILKQLPDVTPIARDIHNNVLKKLVDYKSEHKKQQEELEQLHAMIADLKKLKDNVKVASVVRKHSTDTKAFEALASAAKDALRPLPASVREAIYYRTRGEDYHPKGNDQWDDVQRPIESGQLEMNLEKTAVSPVDSDPKVSNALKTIDALERWLEEPSETFSVWYEAEFDGGKPDIRLRPFWETHLDF